MTYQFKIQLKGISNPTVWRRILVPSELTFDDLHQIIQVVFGWENSHLYFFSPSGYQSNLFIQSFEDDDLLNEDALDSFETKLSEIFTVEKQTFTYIYDFGDNWHHKITLEKILSDETISIPQLIKGKGACLPEDCGGAQGYEELKEILADKKHPQHKEMRTWLGLSARETWNAEEFDIETYKNILTVYFSIKLNN